MRAGKLVRKFALAAMAIFANTQDIGHASIPPEYQGGEAVQNLAAAFPDSQQGVTITVDSRVTALRGLFPASDAGTDAAEPAARGGRPRHPRRPRGKQP